LVNSRWPRRMIQLRTHRASMLSANTRSRVPPGVRVVRGSLRAGHNPYSRVSGPRGSRLEQSAAMGATARGAALSSGDASPPGVCERG
jgi:hypothetical protein